MEALPFGVVTFVFTDVEGSTRLAKSVGDAAWAALLEAHRTIVRREFAARGGREIDSQGDGFFFVFVKATSAIEAAAAGQQALQDHPWPEGGRVRVRMGLHTGEALVRDAHYVGQEVHRASRICDAGHGDQIVVSQTCADIVHAALPASFALTDLGVHRLKDFAQPQRLFQLAQAERALRFPPLRSLGPLHNLPAERSTFVGRDKEIGDVRRLLAIHRLVTLTGIGGSGKTRLALRIGALELDRFGDGVFFVDLAPASDLDVAAQTLAAACGLTAGDAIGAGGSAAIDRALVALTRRRCLVIIDNCEHVIDVAGELVERIAIHCPEVALLATSREALGVEGEQIVQVPSLAVPADTNLGEVTDAIRLFVDRARSANLAFDLNPQERTAVVEICRRLDGIPLAIEFAAARVAHLSATQIAERLNDRFRLLTGGRRRIQRQQTLASALNWSHDLLANDEQIVFRRLAVFAGVFSLDAAEAVVQGEAIGTAHVLGLLGSLVAKSLVTTLQGGDGASHYRLLETVRMYAADRLAESGEAARIRSRHRDWYLRWLEGMTLEELSFSPAAFKAVAAELADLRVAAEWSMSDDRPDLLARLSVRLYGFWVEGNSNQEGRRWLEHALLQTERLSSEERVACHAVLAAIATLEHESDIAVRHASAAIEAAACPSPFLATALGLRAFGTSVRVASKGDVKSPLLLDMRRDAEAAISMAQLSLAGPWRASAELWAAGAEGNAGDLRLAAKWYAACVQSCGLQGQSSVLWFAMAELAGAQHLLGKDSEALDSAMHFLKLLAPVENPSDWLRLCAIGLVPALYAGGQRERAVQLLRDVGPFVRSNGVRLAVNHLLTFAAILEYLGGDPQTAGQLLAGARYLGGAEKLAISFSSPISMAMYMHYLPLVRSALAPEEAGLVRERGRAMTIDDALLLVTGSDGGVARPPRQEI